MEMFWDPFPRRSPVRHGLRDFQLKCLKFRVDKVGGINCEDDSPTSSKADLSVRLYEVLEELSIH